MGQTRSHFQGFDESGFHETVISLSKFLGGTTPNLTVNFRAISRVDRRTRNDWADEIAIATYLGFTRWKWCRGNWITTTSLALLRFS